MEFTQTQVQQYVPPAPLLTMEQMAEADLRELMAMPIPRLVRQVASELPPELPEIPNLGPLVRQDHRHYVQFDPF